MMYGFTNFLDSNRERLDLCIIPQKPDPFSLPVKVDALFETTAAMIRLSPTEGILVGREEGCLVITPMIPTKLFITTTQPDRPGVNVKSVKVKRNNDGTYSSWFLEEGRESSTWKTWNPNAPR